MAGIENNYFSILESLKEKIRLARQKTVLTVNRELLLVYWEIGNTILQQQSVQGWGAKVIDKLAADLKGEFPDMKGFSVRNIKYMRAFAEAYPQFVQQPAAQIQAADKQAVIIVQQAAAQLPWGHHQLMLDKLSTTGEREFYIQKAVENGWSRNVLAAQIESRLMLRQGNAISNFELTLPKLHSDLAKETFKNPYVFDFLAMGEKMQERELENALIQHIKKFMLELGRGFAYVGNQYNLNVEGDDYFLDLLFYNFHLHCFVVFELKVGDFKPEYTGKLNFYINTIDEQIKGTADAPTIGVLLCKTPNDTVVKYALKGIDTPMGVSEYQFTKALPKQLKGEMPSIEELEQELEKEMEVLMKPIDEKKNKLKEILGRIQGDEVKKIKDRESLLYLFNDVLWKIKEHAELMLKEQMEMFSEAKISPAINNSAFYNANSVDLEARLLKENITSLGLALELDAFKRAGTKAFGVYMNLYVGVEKYKYAVGEKREISWKEYLYDHEWTEDELKLTAEKWCEIILDEINIRLEQIV